MSKLVCDVCGHSPTGFGIESGDVCDVPDCETGHYRLAEEPACVCRKCTCECHDKHDEQIATLRAEVAVLKRGMVGDYDLDAWLDWAQEAEKLRAEVERLQTLLRLTTEELQDAKARLDEVSR